MKVFKSINNNIVSAKDESGREVVVVGKGIGFKAQSGMDIPLAKIEKIFVMDSQNNMGKLKDLFASLPIEYIKLTDEIVTYAKKHLKKRLNETSYLTLADHINFAVSRMKEGLAFQNVLLTEVRCFYPEEYAIGLHALELIKEHLDVVMPEDEAASIALHILNAEYDISVSNAFHATTLLNTIVALITKEMGHPMGTNTYHYDRFITHLKFLTIRIIQGEKLKDDEDEFFELLLKSYPLEMKCAKKVAALIYEKYSFSLSRQELANLVIHIKRVNSLEE